MTSLIPKLALLLHSEPHHASKGPLVLSLHEIRHQNEQPILDAGRLLSRDEANEIASAIQHPVAQNDTNEVTFLSPVLLRQTAGSMTWCRPAASASMYWRTATVEKIHAVLPGLIFHVRDRSLYVAAYEGAGAPTIHTKLYHAPLGNVFKETGVCVGSATLPVSMQARDIPDWERVLLGTNFTHVNHPQTLKGGATTEKLIAFWKKRSRLKGPPGERLLCPLGVNAGQWVGKMEDRA